MTRINVNPTRMELKKLKKRLETATRGHKLLKDKTDEMIRRFSVLIKENKRLREEVEQDVFAALSQFSNARSLMSEADIELAFSMPSSFVELECEKSYVMGVEVPKFSVKESGVKNTLPYSFIDTTSEADYSIERAEKALLNMIRLAEVEKTTAMLADEIEKSKRRVNALEYVMIPDLTETIKYITMKLEESERSSRTRLMKVKSMMEQRS